jgi:hypothetical protein
VSATLVAGVGAAAAGVRDAHGTRAFRHRVATFAQVLAAIPDERARSLSDRDARVIQLLGDEVIDLIEEHVSAHPGAREELTLVSAVYEIRRLLEEVGRWRSHYGMARHT